MLLAGCSGGDAAATIDSYTADSAGTTLTFGVVARPGATIHAEVVTQESSGVVVKVRTGSRTAPTSTLPSSTT
jgi:hypothetical protein